MIFLDSWVWLEYFSENENKEAIRLVENVSINRVINPAVLLEIKYRIAKKSGLEKANSIVFFIQNLGNVKIIPITDEIALLASDLRLKYYNKKTRDLSFIDTINLATAVLTGCEVLYTGDKDFEGIDEIKIKII